MGEEWPQGECVAMSLVPQRVPPSMQVMLRGTGGRINYIALPHETIPELWGRWHQFASRHHGDLTIAAQRWRRCDVQSNGQTSMTLFLRNAPIGPDRAEWKGACASEAAALKYEQADDTDAALVSCRQASQNFHAVAEELSTHEIFAAAADSLARAAYLDRHFGFAERAAEAFSDAAILCMQARLRPVKIAVWGRERRGESPQLLAQRQGHYLECRGDLLAITNNLERARRTYMRAHRAWCRGLGVGAVEEFLATLPGEEPFLMRALTGLFQMLGASRVMSRRPALDALVGVFQVERKLDWVRRIEQDRSV
jgi:hypothetical protein